MKRLAALGALLLLAGCTPAEGEITAVDRRRTEQVRAEALEIGATEPVRVQVGAYWPKPLRWNRSSASAAYWHQPVGVTREQVTERMTARLELLRAKGWNIVYVACEPNARDAASTAGTPSPAVSGAAGPNPDGDESHWYVRGYRLVDGVSYWAAVAGTVTRGGEGSFGMELVAPNSHEQSDLFPDRPAAVARGESCLDGGQRTTMGTDFVVPDSTTGHRPANRPNDR